MAKRLGMPEVQPYRTAGRHIVVVGQVPGDSSLRGENINDWLLDTCARLRRLSNRPIVARLHPLARSHEVVGMHDRLEELSVEIDDPSRPFSRTLNDAWSVVTYSSGAAVDALIAGVPAIAMGRASFAWEVTDHHLEKAVDPTLYDRRPWLERLAAAHWCIDEIARGEVWQPLLGALSAGRAAGVQPSQPRANWIFHHQTRISLASRRPEREQGPRSARLLTWARRGSVTGGTLVEADAGDRS